MNHKHKNVLTFLCLASTLLPYLFTFSQFLTATNTENSSLLKYEVNDVFAGNLKHIIQISNPASHRVMEGNLLVPIIRNETARHYVILHNISSLTREPTFLDDGSGNQYAYWSNIIILGKQTLTVEINYYIFSFSTRYLIDSSMIADYNKSSDIYKKYTQPEELIQSDNSKIISKAQELTGSDNNIHEKVSKIYNFVITHIRYNIEQDERGALWALEKRTGDCSEYSYLFVALCRASQIPARVQVGFAFHSASETLENGHMWAEYYLENYGWIPVDATWRQFDSMDYKHFSSIQSIPEIIPYANYVFNNTADPEPVNRQNVQLKPCPPNVFDGDSFAANIEKTVQKIKQAKSALFIGRIFGTSLIFSSEAGKAERTLLKSQFHLQNAIDFFEASTQLAQSDVVNALESAEEASRGAWMLIVKAFALLISIPTVVMLIALVFLKRHQTRLEKKSSEI